MLDQEVGTCKAGLNRVTNHRYDTAVEATPLRSRSKGLANPEEGTVGQDAEIHVAGMRTGIRWPSTDGSCQPQTFDLEHCNQLGDKLVDQPYMNASSSVCQSYPWNWAA